jgi:tryptophanyl-tRNA synthetase
MVIKKRERRIIFDKKYYNSLMKEFGYNPLEFEKIDFSLGKLKRDDLQRMWLCHHDGNSFAEDLRDGKKVIVTTGFGLSGDPHVGTLSQIMRAIALQKAGPPVQIVLGDLDAYNGKAIPLQRTLELAKKYRKFILSLGFSTKKGSILRAQYNELEVLRTSYIIGHFMNGFMFDKAEEDLHSFYHRRGKVDKEMSYRRKLSLNLMTADFIHLSLKYDYKNVLVMLGIDEHQYVRFGREVIARMKKSKQFKNFNMTLSAIYSPMIKGFYNYPKMSKSFPKSSINVNMEPDEIRNKIMYGEGKYDKPENNVVYQMMASVSYYTPKELKKLYSLCLNKSSEWETAKRDYAEMLIKICKKWKR